MLRKMLIGFAAILLVAATVVPGEALARGFHAGGLHGSGAGVHGSGARGAGLHGGGARAGHIR
jgi:hypothetical protein